jgi:murein DD-endopeptidase MepM/ murein hydrolase activator NlpD
MLYTDGIGAGFTAHNHWGVTRNDVTGWGGTGGHLTFTVRSGLGGNLYPYLRDADGTSITPVSTTADYILEGSVQLAERTVSIPMSNLLANGHTLLSGVLFDSDRKGIVYLNDIQLEPPTPGLFTLFDDHLHVQVNRWGNTQLSTTFSEPFAGQNAIKAEFPMAWEGFSLRQTQRVSTDEFGALTFAVKGNQSGQNLLVYAIDEDEDIVGTAVWASDYIHGGVLPTDWQVAWIPLRDLMPGGGDFNGIAVEPSVAGTVWLDEVKVVEGLWFPLWDTTPYTAMRVYMRCSTTTLPYLQYAYSNVLYYDRHAGYDYPKPAGTPVHAATSGTLCFDINTTTKRNGLWRNTAECPYVKAAYSSGAYNSFYIVHENTLLTRYLHGEGDYYGLTKKVYDQIVAKGYAEVKRGDHVGYVGGAGFPVHLHFETELNGELVDPYRLRQTLPIGSGVLWTADPPQ